ncbi:hypothetical protein [Rathayibacter sp. VKM Ac-2630]|uniref:hypothetical protein n=1 Tax=Rathayibacter sp. VKM Ac-2630 TaxID=1938617 RepID=UPI0013011DD8|nr:hypothetical protein [Rathayibacter sp. VKM Ac-2630]
MSKLSGYYWRCACGNEEHSYARDDLDLLVRTHRMAHEALVRRITTMPSEVNR